MTLEQLNIMLQEPSKLFDAGYDDCIEGRKPRFEHDAYLRGYGLAYEMMEKKDATQKTC
jgi:hypothetical protein